MGNPVKKEKMDILVASGFFFPINKVRVDFLEIHAFMDVGKSPSVEYYSVNSYAFSEL